MALGVRPRVLALQPMLFGGQGALIGVGVGVGGTVQVDHPQATAGGMRTTRTAVAVVRIHPNPMRMFAYADLPTAAVFGLHTRTNVLTVTPSPGATASEIQRALLVVPGVAAA